MGGLRVQGRAGSTRTRDASGAEAPRAARRSRAKCGWRGPPRAGTRKAGRPLVALALAWLASTSPASGAGLPPLPQDAGAVHLGVKTCSGTPCHGQAAPGDAIVLQNEHTTWSSARDAHSRAYDVLIGDRSRRMGRLLGLREPPERSKLCLDCHADNVPEAQRGQQFSLEDGVGCEACHGGSERWLGAHLSARSSHARNVAAGLYPTDEPRARAELCLSCHFGSAGKRVDHRLYGAGHPRLSFELDTFTAIQPAHHRIDDDYVERGKSAPPPAQVWAIGQAVLARKLLDALLEAGSGGRTGFPELALLDCHSCHHRMREPRAEPRGSTGLAGHPGVVRLGDASLLMLRQALLPLDRDAALELGRRTRALHAAVSLGHGDTRAAARALRERVDALLPRLQKWEVDAETASALARGLAAEALAGEYRDYAAAEQAVMALDAVTETLRARPGGEASEAVLMEALGALLEATRDEDAFRPANLHAPFRSVLDALESRPPYSQASRRRSGAPSGASVTVQGRPSGPR